MRTLRGKWLLQTAEKIFGSSPEENRGPKLFTFGRFSTTLIFYGE